MTTDPLDLDALEEGVRGFEEYDRKRADGHEINTIAALSPTALLSLISRVRAAEREAGALREALAKYGRHGEYCSLRFSRMGAPALPCTCGLDAAKAGGR